MSQPCPCTGRLRSAMHDIERHRRERDQHLEESQLAKALASKSEERRQQAVKASNSLPLARDCQMCLGTGDLEGNGTAGTTGLGNKTILARTPGAIRIG